MKNRIMASAAIGIIFFGFAGYSLAYTQDELFYLAELGIKSMLKDPYSALFKSMYVVKYESDDNYIVCGEVNAKNSYGGYVGYGLFYLKNDNGVYDAKMWSSSSDLDNLLDNLTIAKTCNPANYTTTTTKTTSTTTTTMPDPTSISLAAGWNLVGLKGGEDASVTELVSAHLNDIESVWKWTNNNGISGWSVYLPNASDGGASYANDKGFSFLPTIHFGEGFWVNATNAVTLP